MFEVKNSGFGDGFDVRLKGEGRVQDHTQVADFRGWCDGAAIHLEEKIAHPLELHLGAHNHDLRFLAVKFEKVGGHPESYCMEAVHYGLWGERGVR